MKLTPCQGYTGVYEELTVFIRTPIDANERMIAAINSTDNDLYPDNGRILVTGKNIEGDAILLGSICESVIYEKGVNYRALIERVRFG